MSQNRGSISLATLAGMATRDSRDVGFPQISTRGLYGTFGDPNMPAGERVPARWFDATAFNSRINGSGF